MGGQLVDCGRHMAAATVLAEVKKIAKNKNKNHKFATCELKKKIGNDFENFYLFLIKVTDDNIFDFLFL